jgi:hypothetical protein
VEQTAGQKSVCLLPAACCLLPAACCLLPAAGDLTDVQASTWTTDVVLIANPAR